MHFRERIMEIPNGTAPPTTRISFEEYGSSGPTINKRTILIVFGILLVVRILAIWSAYFYEEDEISIAAGVAALVRNNVGDLYRYTPQIGYYRLVQYIDLTLGGNVNLIPGIMKVLSALSGALIPVIGMFAFRRELNLRERWLVVLSLAINPIIWKSSQYGNTAILASAFATAGLVILSNRHRRTARIVALALFGIAALIRADTVLLAPVVLFFLYRQTGSLGGALRWSVLFGAFMALVYGVIFTIDPRIDSAPAAVVRHMTSARPTEFWEYLIWAMSPIPLMFAVSGMSDLFESRPRLSAALALWFVPTMLFYFGATTTPRYFLNCALPLSIASAVGICRIAGRMADWLNVRVALAISIGFASLHLILPIGHFTLRYPFSHGYIMTDDRSMPTGALLIATFSEGRVLARSLPDPHFDGRGYWEPRTFTKALERLADMTQPKRTVVILLEGGWPHAFHFHAQAAGARYISREPSGGGMSFASVTWMELGNARIMTVNSSTDHYQKLTRFDVVAGDQIWVLGADPFPNSLAVSKMPAGLSLLGEESFDSRIRVFRVAGP